MTLAIETLAVKTFAFPRALITDLRQLYFPLSRADTLAKAAPLDTLALIPCALNL